MFRYERPQKGRYRQFYQFGAEVFGLETEDIDFEIIMLTYRIWKKLGLDSKIKLEINSIGSYQDREKYKKELIRFLKKNEHILDEDCKRRLYTNPLRILDSKNQDIKNILTQAPILDKYFDTNTKKHFKKLCKMINDYGIPYEHNKNLVRGLDYYSNTVFEWKSNELGAQNTVCAGGRYNFLFKELSSQKISGIGFAIGMERLISLSKKINIFYPVRNEVDIYIIIIGKHNKYYGLTLSEEMRNLYPKLRIFINFSNDNLSKKITHAVNMFVPIAILIGDDEIKKNCVLVKDLIDKKQYYILRNEILIKINCFLKKLM